MAIPTITPAEVNARIARGEPVDLIDVRTASEWNSGHAVGARHVPLSQLDPAVVVSGRVGKLDDPIYIICATDARSSTACEKFQRAGFTQAVNVEGGTSAWNRSGLPMQHNHKTASLSVVKQVAILFLVAFGILFLMPCSPLSVWGAAYCPAPAAVQPAAPVTSGVVPTPAAGSVDFDREVIAASALVPVLVDFHATWCPPCKLLGPEIDALAKERGDRLRIVRIDVDQNGAIAQSQGVSSIPDVRLWKNGKEIAHFVGFRARAEITAWMDQALETK
ncbi:MAG: thioredoxin domain-containing protein [Planctomycetota bacterium]